MSRSKPIRALLAAASLLLAMPLMAQTQSTAASAAPTFPLGRYTLQALDSTHAPPPGLVVEFTPTTLSLINGGQVMETHQTIITGPKWEIFELGGNCTEPGDYLWHVDGTTLWMELVNDPCTERAQSITSVRFIHQ